MEKLGRDLFEGPKGGELRRLAESPESRALGEKFDAAAAQEALRSGDGEKLRALLKGVLSTDEGRRLAEQLSRMGL